MLDHIQECDAAARIRKALTTVLERGEVKTRDLGGTAKTGEFAQAICREIERG
jgi:isocitrate/isopropylmalate dehydrogenase